MTIPDELAAMTATGDRIERDTMGELAVPNDALWGAQTQRAIQNFAISGVPMPARFIAAVALVKQCAARANAALGLLEIPIASAIESAATAIVAGQHGAQFPIDVLQTGSGTSTNMNVNEVIAHLASRALGRAVHPNDHVNLGQSSNDVIPTAIHVSAALALRQQLLPALIELAAELLQQEQRYSDVVKTGRTHLMDAMPVTLGQEISAWRSQVTDCVARLRSCEPRLLALAQGGTAVGTGINTHPQFAARFVSELGRVTSVPFTVRENFFAALASQDTAVELSGQLRVLAVTLSKIANDLRWMNSGPLAGLAEIQLPALQPGSSIMPGKVNPVIPEAVVMAAARAIGHDAAIAWAGQAGNFQLHTMLPLIAEQLLGCIALLANAAQSLGRQAIAGITPNLVHLQAALARNPILITALNPVIGYERAAQIAKQAYAQGRAIRDVALELSGLSAAELDRLLDPGTLTRGGLQGGGGSG